MAKPVDSKSPDSDPEVKGHETQVEHGHELDEKTRAADFKADAVEAENAEINLGVIDAVKAYPMATLWAFIMSCTIVSCLFCLPL